MGKYTKKRKVRAKTLNEFKQAMKDRIDPKKDALSLAFITGFNTGYSYARKGY